MDIVPKALEQMRNQFTDGTWTKRITDDNTTVIWKHSSERVTLYEGDITIPRPELNGKFHAIYDKDSFGALPLNLREPYCERLSEYTKQGGIVYSEVKNRNDDKGAGPPFHVEKNDLMEKTNFGTNFIHKVSLGEVYPISNNNWTQTGHIMIRR